jgi:hypothetical protein
MLVVVALQLIQQIHQFHRLALKNIRISKIYSEFPLPEEQLGTVRGDFSFHERYLAITLFFFRSIDTREEFLP